jgi:hypothetical protein
MNKADEIHFELEGAKARLIFIPNGKFKYACSLVNRPTINALRDFPEFTFAKDSSKFSR